MTHRPRTRRNVAVLASSLAGLLLLAACSSSSGKSTKDTSSGTSVTLASSALPGVADIDPKSASDSSNSQNVTVNVAATLFGYNGSSVDPDSAATIPDPQPELATSGTPSANGLTWTFTLRSGVKSQDGNTLTPADVVWTMKRALKTAQSGANLLKGMHINTANPATAVGANQVAFHLTAPSSLVEKTLAVSFLGIIDEKAVAAHAGANDPMGYTYLATHSATFGPYMVSSSQLPTKEVLVANPNYWRGTPKIAKATFVQIADDSTRLETALSGQVNYATTLSVADSNKIKSSSTTQVDLQPNVFLEFYLVFEFKNPLAKNVDVRKGISYAINRKQIATTAYNGLATPVTSCVPNGLDQAADKQSNTVTATGDTAKAKQLLSAASDQTFTIAYPTVIPEADSLAQVVRSNLQQAGLNVALKPYSSYTTFLADQAAGKFPIGLNGFGANVEDAGYFLYTLGASASSYDLGGYKSAAFDTAATKAMSTTGAAHDTALAQTCGLALQDVPTAGLVSVNSLAAASKKFTTLSSVGGHPLLYNMVFG